MTLYHVSRENEYKEVNTIIRHYSNMRFLIIPIFFAINGAIVIGLQNERLRSVANIYYVAAAFSAILMIVFSIIELNLNRYIDRFVKDAIALERNSFWSKRPKSYQAVTISVIGL